uniref:Uncharacterized protein AlNc14C80G5259 n=1 Tax=Albugo laibachii Nc14 TaxID=890382 RepID=F0WF65_9STRA|nr:conserved hypothetical protein [Albugo laibachii Nc14]|eukprot:CCA19847.1 conserved hypothetical protein [Albugo laibachii Nc14]
MSLEVSLAPIKNDHMWTDHKPSSGVKLECQSHSSPSSSDNFLFPSTSDSLSSQGSTLSSYTCGSDANAFVYEPFPAFAAPRSMWNEHPSVNPFQATSMLSSFPPVSTLELNLLDIPEPKRNFQFVSIEDEMDDAQILMGFLSEPTLTTNAIHSVLQPASKSFFPIETKGGEKSQIGSFNEPVLDARKKKPASRLCRVPGCTKGIRSKGLCKAHGGGRRCTTPGCTISDQGGGHCIAHGGGRRCSVEGCQKSAQSKGRCKLHGGSRRCRVENCMKNGQVKGLCRSHYSDMVSREHEGLDKAAYKSF